MFGLQTTTFMKPPLPLYRLVIWLGSLCCFCGYFGLYLLASGKAPGDFYQLLLFATCAGVVGYEDGMLFAAVSSSIRRSMHVPLDKRPCQRMPVQLLTWHLYWFRQQT